MKLRLCTIIIIVQWKYAFFRNPSTNALLMFGYTSMYVMLVGTTQRVPIAVYLLNNVTMCPNYQKTGREHSV